jgi:hypothetical protein
MSITRRLAIAVGAATAATSLVVGSPAAFAAPKTGITFSVTCPGLGTFDVVSPPSAEQASFTPAFLVGTNQVAIPYNVTGTITGVPGGPVTFHDVKPAPVPGDAMTCTFRASVTEGDVTATISGTAVVVVRGQP